MTEAQISYVDESHDLHTGKSLAIVVTGETLKEVRKNFDEIMKEESK